MERGKSLNNFAPGKKLGGNIFENRNNLLPTKANRVWYEADVGVDYTMKRSNIKNPGYRILYSNDGLIYGTFNHYKTFSIFVHIEEISNYESDFLYICSVK